MAKCVKCYREYNDCSVRICPKTGLKICRYCCKKCKESYIAAVGEGCRLCDQKPKVPKAKKR